MKCLHLSTVQFYKQSIHSVAKGLHYDAEGLSSAAQGPYFAAMGLHFVAQGLDYDVQRPYSVVEGLCIAHMECMLHMLHVAGGSGLR